MKRRILLITYHFPPLNSVASSRTYAFARYLAELGNDVTVVTPEHRGDGCNFTIAAGSVPYNLVHAGIVNNVNINDAALSKAVVPSHGFVAEKLFKLKKYLAVHVVGNVITSADAWMWTAAQQALKVVHEKQIEVVISSFSPIASHLAAYYLKRQVPELLWVADYRDLWTFYDAVPPPMPPLGMIQFMIERHLLKKADCVVTVSELLKDVIEEKYHRKVHVVENGYFPEDVDPAPTVALKPSPPYVFTSTGSIHLYMGKRDPTPLLLAFAKLFREGKLVRQEVEIRFYGDNTYLLKPIVEQSGLADVVQLLPLVSRTQSLAIQKSSAALVFLESDRSHSKGFLTGKLFEYMVSHRPILAIGISSGHAAADLIAKSRTGYVCGVDIDRIAAAVMEIVSGRTVDPDMAEIGKYRRDRLTEKLAGIIESSLLQREEQHKPFPERRTS